jgi:hypothetical protein
VKLIFDVIPAQAGIQKSQMSLRATKGIVAWIKFLMSFPRRRESREYLNELYSKFLYNFAYFKYFFWIPAFAGMTYSTFFEPCTSVKPRHDTIYYFAASAAATPSSASAFPLRPIIVARTNSFLVAN